MRVDQTIVFTPTDTEMAITISVVDDSIALEPTESLLWNLELITVRDGVEISSSTSDVQIIDDDGRSVCLQYAYMYLLVYGPLNHVGYIEMQHKLLCSLKRMLYALILYAQEFFS